MSTEEKKSPFEEFVESKTEQEKKIDWGARKKLWLTKLNDLYSDIQSWLSELIKAGKITISKGEINISEERIGTYKAPTLKINIGSETVTLTPAGTLIIGGHGRVDVSGKSGEVILILSQKNYRPGVEVNVFTSQEEVKKRKDKQRKERETRPEPSCESLIWLYVRRGHKMEYFPLTKSIFEDLIMAVSGN